MLGGRAVAVRWDRTGKAENSGFNRRLQAGSHHTEQGHRVRAVV
jgi:hypothetical protein